jgi:alpha-galactosidase
MPKVTVIGAGSVEFTRGLLADLLGMDDLGPLTIALHDIDPERLETALAVARWTSARTGATARGARVEAHADRRAALDGADYVVNAIQVGGYRATLIDFEVPKRYGLRQTIADTIGVGGIFRGLRTIPVLLAIAEDMAELCPRALLLNYTNPMAMLPWAVQEGSRFQNVVGLCHSVRDTHALLARLVGVPLEEVRFVTAGFNHQAFVLTFQHRDSGESLYPRLDHAIERDPELRRKVRVELYRRLGYFPTESSEHAAEYLPWFLRHDDQVERFRVPIDEYLRRSEANLDEHAETKRLLDAGQDLPDEPGRQLELASEVIHSIQTGTPRLLYANVRNDGLISSLPDGCCVEVPCLVDRAGLQPTAVGSLPPQLAALNRSFLNVVELTVRAALEQDRRHVYHAAMLDPNTAATLTLDQIVQLCDDLIEAHGDALPAGIRKP